MHQQSPDGPPTVLVVEDEESVRLAIEAGLELIGDFNVLMAADAPTGIRILDEAHPEIVLLDLVMPGMDGMEFLQAVRTRVDGFKPRRMILMTAHTNPISPDAYASIGLDAVLPKPFRLNDLASILNSE